MAYNTQYGYDDKIDYSKELLRTDISDPYRKILEKERQNKIEHLYGGKEPTLEGSNLTYTQKHGTNNNGNQFANVKTVTNASIPYQIATLPNNLEVSGDVKYKYVGQANQYLQSALSQIQSGKTSYSDDVRAMIEKIQNREAFSYDLDTDQLFQQALASAMGSGKQAMQDTIGQASALTGGYGSTYATSAGNQSYNAFIEDAYDNLPQYYQMAYDAYKADTQDMYQLLGMLSDADAREYQRLIDAYSVAYDADNNAYNRYRDTVNDAWREKEFDYNAEQDAIKNEQWQQSFDYGKEQDVKANEQWQQSFEYQSNRDNIKDSRYLAENDFNGDKVVDAKDERDRTRYEQGDLNFDGVISDDERAYISEVNSGGDGNGKLSNGASVTSMPTYKQKALEAYKNGTYDAYINSLGLNEDEQDEITAYVLDAAEDGGDTSNAPVRGLVEGFRIDKGDNFDISVDGEKYRVENQGEVTKQTLIDEFNKLSVNDGEAFFYSPDSRVYVKKGGKYYYTGATEVLGFNTGGHNNLKSKMYTLANGGAK